MWPLLFVATRRESCNCLCQGQQCIIGESEFNLHVKAEHSALNVLKIELNPLLRFVLDFSVALLKHFLRSQNEKVVERYPTEPSIEADNAVVDETGLARLRLHVQEQGFNECMR